MGVPFIPPPPPPPRKPEPFGGIFSPSNLPRKAKPQSSKGSLPKSITRSQLREDFKKIENTWDIKMQSPERVAKEKSMLWKDYGEKIDLIAGKDDIKRRIKKLTELKYKQKTTQDRLGVEHEINLLNKEKARIAARSAPKKEGLSVREQIKQERLRAQKSNEFFGNLRNEKKK